MGAALTEREQGCHLAKVQILVAGEASDWIGSDPTSDLTSDLTSHPTSDPGSKGLLVDFRLLHCPPGLFFLIFPYRMENFLSSSGSAVFECTWMWNEDQHGLEGDRGQT